MWTISVAVSNRASGLKSGLPLVFLVFGLAATAIFPPSLSVLLRMGVLAEVDALGVFSSFTFVSLAAFEAGVTFFRAETEAFEAGVSFFLTGSSFSSELLSELDELEISIVSFSFHLDCLRPGDQGCI